MEVFFKVVSQMPVGGKYEDDFLTLERDDPFTFIISVKGNRKNGDKHSESIDSVLFR